MTKNEEIAHFQAFIDALPRDSYLRDLFAPLAPTVENMIRDDLADSDRLSDIWAELARERRRLDELRKQHMAEIHEHDKKARDLRRAADLARGELAEILAQANSLIASTRHIIARAG